MTDEEARSVLREHGEEPPVRGKLGADWRAKATHYADQDGGELPLLDDGGVPADAFEPAEADTPPDMPAERRPSRVKRPAVPGRGSLRQRLTGTPDGKRKPAHKRVPVDRLVSRVWETLGNLAGRVDVPLGRCLVMQAPVAGLILEDVVKGTAIDRGLQPIARAEEKAEKVIALAAPPMLIMGMEYAAGLPEEQKAIRMAILQPMLEEALITWVRVAGDKVEQQLAREKEEAPAREKARELMFAIFGPPPDTVPGQTVPEPDLAGAPA